MIFAQLDHAITGWDVLLAFVVGLPGLVAAIIGLLNRATAKQVKDDLLAQATRVKEELLVVTNKAAAAASQAVIEGHDRASQNAVILKKQDELHEAVNGGLAAAKAEIVSLKAQLVEAKK